MAKRIPPHKVEEIYNAADTVEILSDFLQMKKRGSNYFALSPFSNEKTPSFAISPTKNIWKDFSTGKGGNAVTFLMESEGMSYVEALKYIAEKYNIDLEMEETPEDYVRQDKRESLYILNEFAAKYFNEQLKEGEGRQVGYSYFKERGILESTMETFQLGYSPQSWDAFSQEALRNQFQEEFIVETGLGFKSDRDGKLLDRFRGRIMFPIHNHLGKVVGFGGRILSAEKKMAKYINSPESEVYQKSYILYGLHQGKKAIRDVDRCLLVEGYMDVIALYQAGIENVVASSGTALTVEQIRLIKRFTKNVLLIYDSDRAGVNAAVRGIDLLLEQDIAVRVLLLPEGEDPDSFVKSRGKSGFDAFVAEKSQDFIDFKLNHLAMSLDWSDPQQKTVAIHEAAQTLAHIPDQVKRAVYIELTAGKLGIGVEVMTRAINRAIADLNKLAERANRRAAAVEQRELVLTPEQKDKQEDALPLMRKQQELELIRLALNYHDRELHIEEDSYSLLEYIFTEIEDLEFESPPLEAFRKEMLADYSKKEKLDVHFFLNHPETSIASLASQLITIPYEVSANWEKYDIKAPSIDENLEESVYSALMHFKLHKVKSLLREIQNELRDEKEPKALEELMRKFLHLTELKIHLTTELGIVITE